ncbi:MAG: hypothetical protein PUI14_04325 [Firmicutes bacterium]|nr:hypothetical protein [Clostridiales bacterium]MDD7130925.1 hypothetical protein [Bacillota bacterium]
MDTIKLSVDGHEISFSTKSLTIDDKVYLYTGISAIKHSSAKKLYLFKYENSWHKLPYEDKDQKKVATIFRRVAEMNAKRSAKAEAASPAKAVEDNAEPADADEINKTDVDTVTDTLSGTAAEPAAAEPETAEPEAEGSESDEAAEASLTEEESPAEDKGEESEGGETEETESNEPAEAEGDESAKAEGDSPELSEAKLRKKRLIKAFAILAVIIALFVLAGVAYFFIFGTSNDASQSPNTDSTHEYNDIDELIDEMNE